MVESLIVDLDPDTPEEERERRVTLEGDALTEHQNRQRIGQEQDTAEKNAEIAKRLAMRQAVQEYKDATTIAGTKLALLKLLRAKGDLDGLE